MIWNHFPAGSQQMWLFNKQVKNKYFQIYGQKCWICSPRCVFFAGASSNIQNLSDGSMNVTSCWLFHTMIKNKWNVGKQKKIIFDLFCKSSQCCFCSVWLFLFLKTNLNIYKVLLYLNVGMFSNTWSDAGLCWFSAGVGAHDGTAGSSAGK